MADEYWVTWQNGPDGKAARDTALLWGPQPNPPVQLAGFFLAGPFKTKADAQGYENQIGTGAIIPLPGTPIVGDTSARDIAQATGIASIGDFFSRLTSSNTWLRVAEFGIAGILLFAGINHLLGNPAGRAVRDTVKGAAIIK